MTTQQTVQPSAGSRALGRERRFWIAGFIAVSGLLAAMAWTGLALLSAIASPADLARTPVPGTVNVSVGEPGTQYVYYEGSPVPTLEELALRVSDPDGATVAVEGYGDTMEYDAPDGSVGAAVADFEASSTGTYAVTIGLAAPGQVAVGESITHDLPVPIVGSAAVVMATGAIALTLVLRRPRT